ncbi:hypothetical protein HQ325_17015 [Rhodococcus sp. BP-349]|uniref:hypothetical protein n=1 Tax=unclassified Rhodococcus (in: high G+C Gram-positive bacteria) TaxID=192944 RepID=UPI001C9B33DD|nr:MULTISPECIES: hypothetical protein [unclassified Rhodococcus (in: high G+C Gram-positive bacteria)]MBY6540378.1 hypothetical protein [Rhodococcus sp. BP-363]MBY6545597.1 hypothetical protein [Rhodococcus sp. BP-369]MBY6564827.1 hypothetical protein [Rhodococcus sp. BP-370]MBY6578237.1 hypothetical protein [Rhodococcus sp. BP-364]MBY6587538.1 hypothetical protein [Rhodococcus sp. BP-358]
MGDARAHGDGRRHRSNKDRRTRILQDKVQPMWCHFLGGNLDRRSLDVDTRDIVDYQGRPMCSPAQDADLVLSHGRCVYVETDQTLNVDGRTAHIFEHYGDWRSDNPPPFAANAAASRQHVTMRGADETVPEHWSYADLLADVSIGEWVREHIPRFDGTVAALVPDIYPTYLRLLHPAWTNYDNSVDDNPVRWTTIAERLGAVMHQTIAWGSMIETGVRSGRGTGRGDLWHHSPRAGELPTKEIESLAAVLAEHTTTPDDCYFGFWEGLGMTGVPVNHPRMVLPSREHLLIHGTVADAVRELHGFLPSVWWPADRAWFVATDVDLTSTYVGGSTALANALYGETERFEAIDSWRGARITWDCDTINPRPEGPHTHD